MGSREPSGSTQGGARLLRAEIAYIQSVHPEVFRVGLAAKGITRDARPGQFYMLGVGDGLDPLLPRPFAVHRRRLRGAGAEGMGEGLEILFQVVGKGTKALSLKSPGQWIQVVGPLGRGWETEGREGPILVAGGMGVASLICLAEEMDPAQAEVAAVFLGARSPGRLWCAEEFEALGLALHTAVEEGDHPFKGTVVDLLGAHEEAMVRRSASVFACGPPAMVRRTALWAMARGLPCQVSLESPMACGVGVCLGCVVKRADGEGYLHACQDGPVMDASLVDWGAWDERP
jgi:dihydroorotate dehydrogenase electron transfer subunit